jgi:transposase-like protein
MESKRHTRSYWEQLVTESNVRGVVAVARAHGVKERTLAWWRWRLKREELAKARERSDARAARVRSTTEPELLPVFVAASQHGSVELKVGDVTIRIERDSDVSYIAALVAALRTC